MVKTITGFIVDGKRHKLAIVSEQRLLELEKRFNNLVIAAKAAIKLLGDEQELGLPAHEGSCTPESGCDYTCMVNSQVAEFNGVRHRLIEAVKACEENV